MSRLFSSYLLLAYVGLSPTGDQNEDWNNICNIGASGRIRCCLRRQYSCRLVPHFRPLRRDGRSVNIIPRTTKMLSVIIEVSMVLLLASGSDPTVLWEAENGTTTELELVWRVTSQADAWPL